MLEAYKIRTSKVNTVVPETWNSLHDLAAMIDIPGMVAPNGLAYRISARKKKG